jgi:hypothetical protein
MKRLVLAAVLLGCGGEQETEQERACDTMAYSMCDHLGECESPAWSVDCRQRHRDWCVRAAVPVAQAMECGAGFRELTCARVLDLALPPACEF